jgi:hypothetical protein
MSENKKPRTPPFKEIVHMRRKGEPHIYRMNIAHNPDCPGGGVTFEYGYIRSEKQLVGKMFHFRPHWWAQYLGDGTEETFNTKAEAVAWIKEWDEIGA